ncbi:hypothetical protein BSKO_03139 [Bryopsis sp. KO-2023]|nr:hypothetical protein BSKO_03139 [Bryopsis sp. KO-2023]
MSFTNIGTVLGQNIDEDRCNRTEWLLRDYSPEALQSELDRLRSLVERIDRDPTGYTADAREQASGEHSLGKGRVALGATGLV